jgi:hypothetical protein
VDANRLEQDPLFQLNLMIWLSWPSPVVSPMFYDNGYELYLIAPSLPVPVPAQITARSATPPLRMVGSPRPDLLLRHREHTKLITLECKASSFSANTDQAYQATALLVCTGEHVATVLGLGTPTDWRNHTIYAVAHPQQTAMPSTLQELLDALDSLGVERCPDLPTSLGIEVAADGVYLNFADTGKIPFPVADRVKVKEVIPGEDPRPLYVIPVDPSIGTPDQYSRDVLVERIRLALAAAIGSRADSPPIVVRWDELMAIAIPVWDHWRDEGAKSNLRQQVKRYVRRVLETLRKRNPNITVEYPRDGSCFILDNIEPEAAKSIKDYFASTAYRKGGIDLGSAAQLGFDDLDAAD